MPDSRGLRDLQMKHATSVALYEHWQRLRGDGRAAARAAIEPREFGPLLPDLFLIELGLATGAALFRYCGASVARRFGRDLEGESFLTLWSAGDRLVLRRSLGSMSARQSGFVLGLMAETAGGGYTAFEMPLLPLRGESGCDSALGCMVRIGGHEDASRVRERILSLEIRSHRFLGGPRPWHQDADPLDRFGIGPSVHELPRPTRIGPGHLRLVFSSE